jgi:cytochrome oxidase Cu insertion factor (SCO1/SenC/PrrC family)
VHTSKIRRSAVLALLLAAGAVHAETPPTPSRPAATAPATAIPPAGGASPEARRAKARAYFTDTALLDQDGRRVRFFGDVLDGNVVVVSFIFTRCSGACPLMARKLNGVRRALGDEFPQVTFVSLSVDPDHDGPAELARFAEVQEARYPNWRFLTGRKEDVSLVAKRLGEWPEEPGDHTTAFLAGNVRTGHWTKIRPDMPAAGIAETLRRLVAEDRGGPDASPRASN